MTSAWRARWKPMTKLVAALSTTARPCTHSTTGRSPVVPVRNRLTWKSSPLAGTVAIVVIPRVVRRRPPSGAAGRDPVGVGGPVGVEPGVLHERVGLHAVGDPGGDGDGQRRAG